MNVDPESAYWARIHAIADAAPPLTVEQIAGIAAMLPPLSPAEQLRAVQMGAAAVDPHRLQRRAA